MARREIGFRCPRANATSGATICTIPDRQGIADALWSERARQENARATEERRRDALERVERQAVPFRNRLRSEALAFFQATDKAELWLRTTQRQRGIGQAPLKHCVDEKTLTDCLNLLRGGTRRRR